MFNFSKVSLIINYFKNHLLLIKILKLLNYYSSNAILPDLSVVFERNIDFIENEEISQSTHEIEENKLVINERFEN